MTEYAFPRNEKNDDGSHHLSHDGMTLRDYFAAQALTAVVTRTDASTPGNIASAAYAVADAMLEERGGG